MGCSGDDESAPELLVTISASNEEPEYNETFTISWESNASQCYAQSTTGSWLGDVGTSGSRDFLAKREGLANFGIQCRTSINFAGATVEVDVQKDFIDYFDFNNAISFNAGSLTFNSDSKVKVLDNSISDFNLDFRLDLAVLIEDEGSNNVGDSQYYILIFYGQDPSTISEDNPYSFVEINGDNCVADMLVRGDYNADNAPDLMTVSSSPEESLGKRGICFFISSPDGLTLQDEEYLVNDTALDLTNVNVGSHVIYDLTVDGIVDVLLMGNGGTTDLPFYVVSGDSGPTIQLTNSIDILNPYNRAQGCSEGFSFLCDWITNDYQFRSSTLISADADGVLDLIHSVSSNNEGKYILYNTRSESIYFDFSQPVVDYVNRSISAPDGYAMLIEPFDGNLDGYPDLFSIERSDLTKTYKFNIYEKVVPDEGDDIDISSTNNGDFIEEFAFGDNLNFASEILTFDTNFDGLQEIFAPYTELPLKTINSSSQKHFLVYENTYTENEDETFTQAWIKQDFSDSLGLNPDSVNNSWIDIDADSDIDAILLIPELNDDLSIKYKFEIYLNNSL
tara:strand:+ start:870 stop:2561 length:1692 start_codon:yes stop_codon:yes gene_type:complete